MLTRIEADGLGCLHGAGVDLGPLVAAMGPHGAGKSTLLTAARLIGLLARHPIDEAFEHLGQHPLDVFRWDPAGEPAGHLRLAAEVTLPPALARLGEVTPLQHRRIRYEVTLVRRREPSGRERLLLDDERAAPIGQGIDGEARRRADDQGAAAWPYGRSAPWLTTGGVRGDRVVTILPDALAGRRRALRVGAGTTATILSRLRDPALPHLMALRRALAAIRAHDLRPEALRAPGSLTASQIAPDGADLPSALAAIRDGRDGVAVLRAIASDLTTLVPGCGGLRLVEDRRRRELRLALLGVDGAPAPPLSDGAWRILGLLTLLRDPRRSGPLLLESPEAGLTPQAVRALVAILRATGAEGPGDPRQVLMTSNGPTLLSALADKEVLYADRVTAQDGVPATRFRWVRAPWARPRSRRPRLAALG